MNTYQRIVAFALFATGGALAGGARADAQSVPAGIVTTLEGTATVARASLPVPTTLRFKDVVYVDDRITTGTESVTRILLGNKAVVSIREHSVVTLWERAGTSVIAVAHGRVAVTLVKSRMQPGETVEVVTPNAASTILGTVIVAEVDPLLHGVRSTITVLTGMSDVAPFDGVRSVGPAIALGALQRVVIADTGPAGTPTTISLEAAQQLGQQFSVQPSSTPHATAGPGQEAAIDLSVQYAVRLSLLSLLTSRLFVEAPPPYREGIPAAVFAGSQVSGGSQGGSAAQGGTGGIAGAAGGGNGNGAAGGNGIGNGNGVGGGIAGGAGAGNGSAVAGLGGGNGNAAGGNGGGNGGTGGGKVKK